MKRVRVTVDFTLEYDQELKMLPKELGPGNSILDFIEAGCRAVNVADAVILPRASMKVRFVKERVKAVTKKASSR